MENTLTQAALPPGKKRNVSNRGVASRELVNSFALILLVVVSAVIAATVFANRLH